MKRKRKYRPAPWTLVAGARKKLSPRQRQLRSYRILARSFVETQRALGAWCPVSVRGLIPEGVLGVTEVHHVRGRLGALLLDDRHWMAVSRQGHQWIHDHPARARELGWLAQPGEWGRTEK